MRVTSDIILSGVAAAYGVAAVDIVSWSRAPQLAGPRQVALYLMVKLTDKSMVQIGMIFGGREPETVRYAQAKVQKLIEGNARARLIVGSIEKGILGAAVALARRERPERTIYPMEVAERIASDKRNATNASVDEIMTLALAYISRAAVEAEPEPVPKLDPDAHLRAEAKAVVLALRELENLRFGAGERAAQVKFNAALKSLQTRFEEEKTI